MNTILGLMESVGPFNKISPISRQHFILMFQFIIVYASKCEKATGINWTFI